MRRIRLVLSPWWPGSSWPWPGLAVTGRLPREGGGTRPGPAGGDQWNLEQADVAAAWPTTRGEDVVVAVVDSGVDARHPDLRDRVVGSTDCVGATGDPDACRPGGDTDPDGHGTHVAGIVAASADDGRGVAGVAPEARLLAVRALVRPTLRAAALRGHRQPGRPGRRGPLGGRPRGRRRQPLGRRHRRRPRPGAVAAPSTRPGPPGWWWSWPGATGPRATDLGDAPAIIVSAVTAGDLVPLLPGGGDGPVGAGRTRRGPGRRPATAATATTPSSPPCRSPAGRVTPTAAWPAPRWPPPTWPAPWPCWWPPARRRRGHGGPAAGHGGGADAREPPLPLLDVAAAVAGVALRSARRSGAQASLATASV